MAGRNPEPTPWKRRSLLALAGALGAGAACGRLTRRQPYPSGPVPNGRPTGPAVSMTTTTAREYLYLAVVTGTMLGKSGWPAFLPGNMTVPAHCVVLAEVHCLDDGVATVAGGYEQVRGTMGGSMQVFHAAAGPQTGEAPQTVQTVSPSAIAHTFTVSDLGLNVPLPPLSTVRFRFQTTGPGQHAWQCMASCGTGPGGWQGTMTTAGWMRGTLTIQ